ncbi:ECF transporter S component [Streptococcus sp. S784/96/1]|uniref:ECF transporter S component n=1 Tax=Streptococcus sp. S784/96/1 TaxID=2653499 RepID=UPI0013867CED|nr:ECF transporter S component [Streptococcus sp. S784/96/1]
MSTQAKQTRRLVYIAILSALSFLLLYVQFPLIPGADFFKIDFSILPLLVVMLVFDLKSAWLALILRSVLTLILNNSGPTTLIGIPMNIMALGVFITTLAFLWKKEQSLKNYVIASIIGTLLLTLVMVVLNIFYAVPAYAAFANFDINKFIGLSKYIFAMVIPFNIAEGTIFAISFYLVHLTMKPLITKL